MVMFLGSRERCDPELVMSEWSTDKASSVDGSRLRSEAWSLVKLFRSGMHRFGVDVLVRALNSYLLVTSVYV
ncbi:unnamed protein product [Brassica oleracea]